MSLKEHQITLEEGAALTKNFRTLPLAQLASLLNTKACSIAKDALQALMDQDGCVSVRFYFGVELKLVPNLTLVAVGVDSNGNDITEGIILDRFKGCPPDYPENSPLIS